MSILEPLCRDAHAESCARLGVIQFQENQTDAARRSLERSCSLESELVAVRSRRCFQAASILRRRVPVA